jgi:hypothetical protein
MICKLLFYIIEQALLKSQEIYSNESTDMTFQIKIYIC